MPPGFSKTKAGPELESFRLPKYVVGPWDIDGALSDIYLREIPTGLSDSRNAVAAVKSASGFAYPGLENILDKHNFIVGFRSSRIAPNPTPRSRIFQLRNTVLEFATDADASAAVTDTAAVVEADAKELVGADGNVFFNLDENDAPITSLSIPGHPETIVLVRSNGDKSFVSAFTPYGRFVLHQFAVVKEILIENELSSPNEYQNVQMAIMTVLLRQEGLIDDFNPTDPGKWTELAAHLPFELIERSLRALSESDLAGASVGIFKPWGYLHFEYDPIAFKALFSGAHIEWVSQILTTVYQAENEANAVTMFDGLSDLIKKRRSVVDISPPEGLPSANCFERTTDASRDSDPPSLKRINWRYKCVGQIDKYAFTAYSNDEVDVKQQTAAQYQLLMS